MIVLNYIYRINFIKKKLGGDKKPQKKQGVTENP
jgi:hypothetical protein